MKFRRYAKLKHSGIDWLGDLPEHWECGPIKRFVRQVPGAIKTGPFGSQLTATEMQAGEIKVYNQRSVIDNDFDAGENYITAEKFKELRAFEIVAGDVLVTTRGTIGKAAIFPFNAEQGVLHPCLLRIQVEPQLLLREFLLLVIQDSHLLKNQLKILSNSTTIEVIYSDTIASVLIPLPPVSEQKAIISFLDREKAKIDSLIAKQEKLIELLKEKRQTVISRAVTKGLDSNAPMKPSGIEWLGDVPEHWGLHSLKFVCDLIRDGTHLPPPRVDDGIPLLSVRNMQDEKFLLRDDDSMISEDDYSQLCRSFTVNEGDVLLAIVGATLGKVAIVDAMPRFHIQRSVAVLRANPSKVLNRFLAYFLRSQAFQNQLWAGVGFSAQPGIYLGAITSFPCPIPPLEEQKETVAYLDSVTTKIDTLIAKAEHAIALQKEHRVALISAAVTGKIDVREKNNIKKAA